MSRSLKVNVSDKNYWLLYAANEKLQFFALRSCFQTHRNVEVCQWPVGNRKKWEREKLCRWNAFFSFLRIQCFFEHFFLAAHILKRQQHQKKLPTFHQLFWYRVEREERVPQKRSTDCELPDSTMYTARRVPMVLHNAEWSARLGDVLDVIHPAPVTSDGSAPQRDSLWNPAKFIYLSFNNNHTPVPESLEI